MSNIYQTYVLGVSDAELRALYDEGETWSITGSLPSDTRLRHLQRDIVPDVDIPVRHLDMLLHAVWREIARRSIPVIDVIRNSTEDRTPSGNAPIVNGHRAFYGYQVIKRLREMLS